MLVNGNITHAGQTVKRAVTHADVWSHALLTSFTIQGNFHPPGSQQTSYKAIIGLLLPSQWLQDCTAGIWAGSTGVEKDIMKCQVISKQKWDNYGDCYFCPFMCASETVSFYDRLDQPSEHSKLIGTLLRPHVFLLPLHHHLCQGQEAQQAQYHPYETHIRWLPKHTAKKQPHRKQDVTIVITWKEKKKTEQNRGFLVSSSILPNRSDALWSFYNLQLPFGLLHH